MESRNGNVSMLTQALDVTLAQRVSVRDYTETSISLEKIQHWLRLAQRAPTAANVQAYSIINVSEEGKRQRIARLAGNQQHIIEAPVFLVFCADLYKIRHAHDIQQCDYHQHLDLEVSTVVDTSLLAMSFALLAECDGYGTVMIGGVRNQPEALSELLALPTGCVAIMGMCIGEIAHKTQQKPRFSADAVLHNDGYSHDRVHAAIRAYDSALKAHYSDAEKPQSPAVSWSANTCRVSANSPRRQLAKKLRGFRRNASS